MSDARGSSDVMARIEEVGRALQKYGFKEHSEFHQLVGLGFVCAARNDWPDVEPAVIGSAWTDYAKGLEDPTVRLVEAARAVVACFGPGGPTERIPFPRRVALRDALEAFCCMGEIKGGCCHD